MNAIENCSIQSNSCWYALQSMTTPLVLILLVRLAVVGTTIYIKIH